MGLQIILKIQQFDEGTVFDVAKANSELMADFHGGFGELYDEFTSLPEWEGPFKFVDGELRIAENWDGDFMGYGNDQYGEVYNSTMVWGCYNDSVFEIIANNISEGKIVFHIDIEGNPNQYRICTPGHVKSMTQDELTF